MIKRITIEVDGETFDHGQIQFKKTVYIETYVEAKIELVITYDKCDEFKEKLEELIKEYAI
jgi:hypothetical protein